MAMERKAKSRDIYMINRLRDSSDPPNCSTTNVFDSSPHQLFLHAGALLQRNNNGDVLVKREAWIFHEYPRDPKKRRSRCNEHGTWKSTQSSEIRSGSGEAIIGYKFEYTFKPKPFKPKLALPATAGLREYALLPVGQNNYSLCVVYKKRIHHCSSSRSASDGCQEVSNNEPAVEEQWNIAATDDASEMGWFPKLDKYKGDDEAIPGIELAMELAADENTGFGDLDFNDLGWSCC